MNSGTIERSIAKRAEDLAGRKAPEETVEELFLSLLGRTPSDSERQLVMKHLGEGNETERAERLKDVYWTLLNLPEFRWNH